MRVALFLLSRAPLQLPHEIALRERVEAFLDRLQIRETVQALGALLELARGLRAAQHQHGEQGQVGVTERQRVVEQVAVLRGARGVTAREAHEAAAREALE